MSIEETEKITKIEKSKIEKIQKLNIKSEHKRLLALKPESY